MKKNIVLLILFQLILLFSLNTYASDKSVFCDNESNYTPMMRAVCKRNYSKMIRIIKRNKYFVTKKRIDAMSIAISNQDTTAVKILLETGLHGYEVSGDLILLASRHDNVEIVKMIYNYGFPIIDRNNLYSPLIVACSNGSYEIVRFLLDNGAGLNQINSNNGVTPLMYAVMNGKVETVKLLLEYGVDKNTKSNGGRTAISFLETNDYVSDEEVKEALLKLLKD